MHRRRRVAPVLAIALLCAAAATAPGDGPAPPAGLSEPVYTDEVTERVEVETPYGTIRGDVRRPVVPEGVEVPVILTYTPYSVLYASLAPTRTSRADDATGDFFVPRGYARAVFDVVGTYGSGGCTDVGGLGERETAAAVVDHLGAQPWSNGRVGMIGASYDGTTAIAAAVEAPAHLVTVVPQVAIDRWYDYLFNDGVRMSFEDNATGLADPPLNSPADYDTVYGVVPPYPDLAGDPAGVAAVLADHLQPCDRVENQQRGYGPDPVYDDFWLERDYRRLARQVEASVLLEGAWLDDNVKHWASTRFFEALPDETAEGLPFPKQLVIGQWSHSTSRFADAQELRHAWFDHFLLGLDTGVLDQAPVQTEANDGFRREEATWPPASAVEEVHVLSTEPPGPGVLGSDGAAASWIDVAPFQLEQQLVSGHCACVRFDGPAVDEAVRIAGSPRLELTATTDAASTHVTPVLLDVAPDGRARPFSRGLFNSNHRHGLDVVEPLVPGEPWSATIELWDVDHVLAPGHRLALVLASANATWGIADETRATTTLDLTATRFVLPVAALD
ncbi:MAG: CocE/NonD family hydrolase [Actinobacteria bacterium]|nr:CocE/NonD family hydrolase [Actinomycetota bacterium]